MSRQGLFVAHPEVVIDPVVPVPRWHLAEEGIARMRRLAASIGPPAAVWASDETKAIEAAGILAARFGLPVHVHPGLAEMDRSSTGYRPKAEFERLADAFFARPAESIAGWERAIDAQARVLAAASDILAGHGPGDLVLVGHGGTGTLLMCALAGLPIDRAHDVPAAGCAWRMALDPPRVVEAWRRID
ncbi:histidine phosphatase family protein [Roseomonas sp. HF4]|uniref:histidine phosphatase family protein n=1 Tax=Roseomonas sp. HF4 TaxID=2562313 RepID=UPI001F0FCED8|nr:histidine phosphatase family protein [Roseomonas sp. HF4]